MPIASCIILLKTHRVTVHLEIESHLSLCVPVEPNLPSSDVAVMILSPCSPQSHTVFDFALPWKQMPGMVRKTANASIKTKENQGETPQHCSVQF